ncbi:helix-turn-helix domain-containing protein [Rhizobium mongolense]|uniref:AlbA family DNA-binding domain-containing protein n=1 Tax=Rhizobium mongolense TaxID=57676 RepID=UPI0035563746
MRGKPIDFVTIEDIRQLILDGVSEGRNLEFKLDIPVSSEEQKAQRTKNPTLSLPRGWQGTGNVSHFGRDALAEEIVAFANSDGGTLILGLEETETAPPRASKINALPQVIDLERRLRDAFNDCIEPRLPYLAVRSIATEDDGSGIVLIETSPSALGPHWVKKSRKPTIRREDRCDLLSMPELHEMVLRRAKSLDEAVKQSNVERARFKEIFDNNLIRLKPANFLGGPNDSGVQGWLKQTGQAGLGVQVTIVPHFGLGIPRLESFAGLIPRSDAIGILRGSERHLTEWIDTYTYVEGTSRKVLGGMTSRQDGGFDKSVTVMRDGQVTVSFIQVRGISNCTCTADLVVSAAGFAVGIYDRLRHKSSYPAAPAEVTVDIHTTGEVGIGRFDGFNGGAVFGRLPSHTMFPTYILGDSQDISVLLNEITGDLMNAGGMEAASIDPVAWVDER